LTFTSIAPSAAGQNLRQLDVLVLLLVLAFEEGDIVQDQMNGCSERCAVVTSVTHFMFPSSHILQLFPQQSELDVEKALHAACGERMRCLVEVTGQEWVQSTLELIAGWNNANLLVVGEVIVVPGSLLAFSSWSLVAVEQSGDVPFVRKVRPPVLEDLAGARLSHKLGLFPIDDRDDPVVFVPHGAEQNLARTGIALRKWIGKRWRTG
jgi:hypothetical protein